MPMVESVCEQVLACFGTSKSPISCLLHQPFYQLLELGKYGQSSWNNTGKNGSNLLKGFFRQQKFLLVEARACTQWSLKNRNSTDWAKSCYVNIHVTRDRVLHSKPESVHWELIILPFTREIHFFCNKVQILIYMGFSIFYFIRVYKTVQTFL